MEETITIKYMKDFLTDEEMNLIETHGATTTNGIISDAQMSKMEQDAKPKEKGLYGKTSDALGEFSQGVAKGELSTVRNLGKVGDWLLRNSAGRVANIALGKGNVAPEASGIYAKDATINGKNLDQALTPEGTAQNIGFTTERIAEFLAPASKVSKFENVVTTGMKTFPKLLTKGVIEGTVAGSQTALQKGEFENEAKINTLIGFISPSLMAGVEKIGSKMFNSVLKPSQTDIKNGFKVENVKKYNVGGGLKTSLSKTSAKLSDLSSKLDDKLADSAVKIDVEGAFQKTVDELKDKKSLIFGQVRDVNSGIDELAQDLKDMQTAFSAGDKVIDANTTNLHLGALDDLTQVPIQIANNQIKRGAGTKGAWVYGRMDKNADAIEKVYSVFYKHLKSEIERVGPEGIQDLNKAMSDLIPIQSALIKRIPVTDRANVIGLGESMAIVGAVFDPRGLFLLLPQLAQKSGAFSNFLMKAADSWITSGAGATAKSLVSGR